MSSYIIFGANSDIANHTISLLHANGHKIYAIARNFNSYTYSNTITTIQSEFTNFQEVDDLIKSIKEIEPEIAGVANFAGSILIKSLHLTTEEDYDSVINGNLKTSLAIARASGKYLSNASILFISSTASLIGIASHELISASKAAINGMVLSLAASYPHKNLRFNAIAPGLIATKLSNGIIANEAMRKISESLNPLGKIGQPNDIANLAAFLLNPENSWITGQIIAVDGGMSSIKPRQKF